MTQTSDTPLPLAPYTCKRVFTQGLLASELQSWTAITETDKAASGAELGLSVGGGWSIVYFFIIQGPDGHLCLWVIYNSRPQAGCCKKIQSTETFC